MVTRTGPSTRVRLPMRRRSTGLPVAVRQPEPEPAPPVEVPAPPVPTFSAYKPLALGAAGAAAVELVRLLVG